MVTSQNKLGILLVWNIVKTSETISSTSYGPVLQYNHDFIVHSGKIVNFMLW